MSGLLQRFDERLMSPPDPGAALHAPLSAAQAATQARLRDWCLQAPATPLRIACLARPVPQLPALVTQLALQLDGSELLQARGRLGRLALRLRVKLQDAGLWPAGTPIWDAGQLRLDATPQALLAACSAFRPRRPTLLWMAGPTPAALPELLERLTSASTDYRRPLRVLLLETQAETVLPAVERLA